MFNWIMKKLGYYKKDQYTLYMLNELITSDEKELEKLDSEGKLYVYLKGRKDGYQTAWEMMKNYYRS